MISSDAVRQAVASYAKACKVAARSPTRAALAKRLGVSTCTVSRVVTGAYAVGCPYTDKPMACRRISNDDFEVIQALFSTVIKQGKGASTG